MDPSFLDQFKPHPVFLAPLAGVSDHPFRRICSGFGAHLTYVEMLSASAINCGSKKTFQMMERHPDERLLGVQLTGKDPQEIAKAIEILDKKPFDTIDINMGCPVQKVTKNGAGSALMKDPDKVFATVAMARQATAKPLSVKMRLGFNQQSITAKECALASEAAGADWLTVHGRLRSDDYSVPVDLCRMADIARSVSIPVLGNGNLFSKKDAEQMREKTGVRGVMVSRGALGNPFVFRHLCVDDGGEVGLEEWLETVMTHLSWQRQVYGNVGMGALCMRKHLLWYLKGWPYARKARSAVVEAHSLEEATKIILDFAESQRLAGVSQRISQEPSETVNRFKWDPKFEMDRHLDRGVGSH
jgi:tRNA-dihydrouridine synthase B